MALSVGISMELNDALDYCNYADLDYKSDLTDTENDEEYAFTPRAFERTVPRSSKRTYGVFLDSETMPERRKRSRVDEQLELLRAAIPNLCTNEKASILAGAHEYIEKLQREVRELQSELDIDSACSDDDVSLCEDALSTEEERPVDSNVVFKVEVVGTEEGLKIHIECEKRPRVLAEIMELLESSGMNVEQVSIVYQEDSQFIFDCLGSEIDGKDIAAESRHVEACLRSLIAGQRGTASPQ